MFFGLDSRKLAQVGDHFEMSGKEGRLAEMPLLRTPRRRCRNQRRAAFLLMGIGSVCPSHKGNLPTSKVFL